MEPHDEKIQECYRITDDKEALDCLARVVQEAAKSSSCPPRIVLLTQDGCAPCDEEHAHHQANIESGAITVVDINSPEGRDICQKNGIDATPAVLPLDCENYIIEPS